MRSKVGATSGDYDLIRYPVITEKSTKILEDSNAYVFVVEKRANKPGIKKAVERIFDVKVRSVNTIVVKGKNKVFRGRSGKRSDFKKAIVRLDAGSRIDLGVGV
ncbi:MAG: 50S ribosomal protein L23 [Holosporales bacterium]|jgi:large subunit ribosomal protein L23|nr:50S ribosomal protein L23 [Holosporales bacterium]